MLAPPLACSARPRATTLDASVDAELGSDDDTLADLERGGVRAHRAVKSVTIAKRDRVELELLRADDELFGQRSASQKRERRASEELNERRHT